MVKKVILVVEDEKDIRETIVVLLESEGYKARQASNGKEAMQWLRTHENPCLVLTDLTMPEMNGAELIECMKNTDKVVTIPVVVISAAMEGNAPSGVRFIKKPFELAALMQHVREFCGKGSLDCNEEDTGS